MKRDKRLLKLSLLLLNQCSGGPDVTTYIVNQPRAGFDYSNTSGTNSGFLPISSSKSDKLICFTQTDIQAMLSYAQAKCPQTLTTLLP